MPDETKVSLNVRCPVCGIQNDVDVPEFVFESKQFGALKIQIPRGGVCTEHQFLIYVDKKGKIRSYETSDLDLSPTLKQVEKQNLSSMSEFIDIIGEFATHNVLHALFLDIPIYMVQPVVDTTMENIINNTLNSMFPDFFKNKNGMKLISRSEFLKFDKNDIILVIDQQGFVLICPWEIDTFQIEKEMLDKILKLNDLSQQKVVFRQSLVKFFQKLNLIGELILKHDDVSISKIKNEFKKHFMQRRVSDYEIQLIKAVLKNRLNIDTSKISI